MRLWRKKYRGKKMKSFAGLRNKSSAITNNLHRNRTGHQTRASTMKTLLITCLCSLAFALVLLGQAPPPAKAPPATGGTSPAAQAPTNPAGAAQQPPAPGQQAPATNLPPGQQPPPPPGEPGAAGQPPAAGQPGVPGAATSPGAVGATSPAAAAATSPAPAAAAPSPEQPAGFLAGNWLIDKFHKGGPVMWPILIVSIIALTVVIERCFWWTGRWFRRDPKRIEKVFTAIEQGDTAEASRLSRGSRDPVLRMMWNGLNHQHTSLQGALQVAAGIEIKRAGRFLVVMDTLVTLAPLLGRSEEHTSEL